jgi:hypothetical protein
MQKEGQSLPNRSFSASAITDQEEMGIRHGIAQMWIVELID